jgi:DNA-binding CsgD family transcriptional regulator/PAS domain-containing protein
MDHDLVIAGIYKAAVDGRNWAESLKQVAEFIGGQGAQFFLWDNRRNTVGFSCISDAIGTDVHSKYCDHYGAIDPRRKKFALLPAGASISCHEFWNDDFVSKSEYYQDFLIPSGFRWSALAKVLGDREASAYLAVVRGRRAGPFEPTEVARLQRILPHLQQATRLFQRVLELRAERDYLSAALDETCRPVIVVGAAGKVIWRNRSAETLLSRRNGLCLQGERLRASTPDENSALDRLLNDALMTAQGRGARLAGVMSVTRPSDRSRLPLTVAPLVPSDEAPAASHPAAVVFASDPRSAEPATEPFLREMYGLTAAEAKLACGIAAGKSVGELAAASGRSKNTLRNQLQAVLTKTDTRRQPELVRLILRGR